ncbi:motile sperm domain-containing protein 2-like [Zerene cesonia]|uniref:motile sperm domain-containing protein 2-like n=1 Tax=Zerene cesonia TaxID=33412 RepID=UPI0018E524C9|nr:motile sperm domain-containing protein 2-like [Zerene cesonia]
MSKLSEIRILYEAKLKEVVPTPTFDPRDLEKVKNDKYLYRVLEHHSNNVQMAADMLFNIMVWRKENNINDINESTVNLDVLKQGLYFPHGRDIDSCLLLVMRSKVYAKGQDVEAVKKVFIYWLERLEREEGGKKITLFFDMDGCGVNNMNINIISYMINVLKCYYPNFINYVIIFQMPWILSAGFKIVKEMLPAQAIERLRMVNKDKLKDLVAPEQALVSWGGKDTYKFTFEPEAKGNEPIKIQEDDNYSPGEMLRLKPTKTLQFNFINNKITAQLIITNMDDSLIAFKIRTTAPEKYAVRPSSGILPTRVSQSIEIILQSGFEIDSVDKDRFLIVSVHVPKLNMSQKELSTIWKTAGSNIDEYRLNCASLTQKATPTVSTTGDVSTVSVSLQNDFNKLRKSLNFVKWFQLLTIVLMVGSIVLNVIIYKNSRQCDKI